MTTSEPRGPVGPSRVPRCAGPAPFARLPRLPRLDDVLPAYDHAAITSVAASHIACEPTTIVSRQIAAVR